MTRRAFLSLLTCLPGCWPVLAVKVPTVGANRWYGRGLFNLDEQDKFRLFTMDGCREFTYAEWIEFTRPTVTITGGSA